MNGTANGVYGGDLPNQINTPWIDFSEQSTIVGWSSFTTKIFRYKVVGKIVYVHFYIAGTSNSTATTFTLPITPSLVYSLLYIASSGLVSQNAGVAYIGYCNIQNGQSANFGYWTAASTSTNVWTNSGVKSIRGHFFYEID